MTEETPLEDFYIESISPKIRKFLLKRGFNVVPQEISRQKEKVTPYDRLYNLGFKIFGLQFKRPKLEKGEIYWEREETQHSTLKKFDWIFYALPFFTAREDYDNGLHLTKILEGKGFKHPRIYYEKRLGMSWGVFITEVFKCRLGLKIREEKVTGYWLDKKLQNIQNFLELIEKYKIDHPEEEKLVLQPGQSYLSLITINIDKREFKISAYIYPDDVLKKFEQIK